ncbi:hypothetical protein BU15DRAFT_65428, partial [Melanogaster broomeanus]
MTEPFRKTGQPGSRDEEACKLTKKPEHLQVPRSCDDEKQLDAQHVVEEAMTQALKHNCPKCQQYIWGNVQQPPVARQFTFSSPLQCNKMSCPSCGTLSCYICREIIEGYNHFQSSHRQGVMPWLLRMCRKSKPRCILYDPVDERHAAEVSQAAKRALAELKKSRPDVNTKQIKVD